MLVLLRLAGGRHAWLPRTSAIDGRGESTSTYDAQGRIVRSYDADGFAIEYAYDEAGNMLSRISASQSLVYGYDERGRMVTVTRTIDGEAPSVTRYEYDQDGNRKAMIGGDGTRTEYGYDSRNRLRELIKKTAAGALLVAMTYNVDASGMRTAVTESDPQGITRTVAWEYDALKRLTREVIDHRDDAHDRTSSWTYDKVGNRLTQAVTVGAASAATTTYSYDVNDRLLSETIDSAETRYTYDDNGNTLTRTSGSDVVEYAYDDANRLVEMRKSGERVGYFYNADGLRVRQTITQVADTPTTTYYVQDSAYSYAQVIEEWAQQGGGAKALNATYTFADDLISQTRYEEGTSLTSYMQADGFGSTRWLTDVTGTITDLVEYDAFGVEITREGSTGVDHLYRGERFDASVAMYDLRARLYNASNGRFLTQDSFAGHEVDPPSLHKYIFNHNDPVNRIDPSGHSSLPELAAAQHIQGVFQTLSRVNSVLNFYGKVNSAIDLVMGMRQLLGTFEGDLTASIPRSFPPKVDFSDAAQKFVSGGTTAFGIGSPSWLAGYIADFASGKRFKGYVMYLPVLLPQVPSLHKTLIKINDHPVYVGLGGTGKSRGSLAGVGVIMGHERMLFRMDIGLTKPGHGSATGGLFDNELKTFDEAPFSFHVYKWKGGPR